MIRPLSATLRRAQPAISSSVRAQPTHKPVAASIEQILMQGDSIRVSPEPLAHDVGIVAGSGNRGCGQPYRPRDWGMAERTIRTGCLPATSSPEKAGTSRYVVTLRG